MKFEKQVAEMRGPYSAIYTPFDPEGEVNLEMLTAIAEYQMAQGIRGFFVTGSTGEGLLLSYEERRSVIQHVVEVCGDRATVIAHVGHPSTAYASRLARAAADSGADWIASVAPIYHGTSFDGAMRHYAEISAASELPFMIYSLGGVIDPHRDVAFFELPNVCGLKYTGANFYSVQQLVRFIDRPIAAMSGFDEEFVAGQSFGFQGGIGTTFNFAPQMYAEIYRQYHAGKIQEASKIQGEINKVTELMVRYENWSYRKAIMKYIGLDCGWARAPYAPLTDEEYLHFAEQLEELNVLPRNHGAPFAST
jgi:N-acetylneuraminate lyase